MISDRERLGELLEHALDYLAWTFGNLNPLNYSDDALAGIESNLSMEVETSTCRGMIHLSWDQPQKNELRVKCANGEAVLRLDRFDQFAVRTSTAFEPQAIRVSYPGDAQPTPRRRLTPLNYADAIYCQIVQVIRAIQLGESPAVDGDTGGRCISLLESALSIATPLDAPWLDDAQRTSSRRLHWKRTA
jgi:hypothetical protein